MTRPDIEDDPGRSEPASDETRRDARRTVAHYAEDVDDYRRLAAMLGLDDLDARPVCRRCGVVISRVGPNGAHVHAADALCFNCVAKKVKAEKVAARRAQQAVEL